MNKTELIEHIAKDADLSKAAAGRALDAALLAITGYLRRGGSVQITGFGTFRVAKRGSRPGRNPRTGVPLKIKAARVPKFSPSKNLKKALN